LAINYSDGSLAIFDIDKNVTFSGFSGHLLKVRKLRNFFIKISINSQINSIAWGGWPTNRIATASNDGWVLIWEWRNDCWINTKLDVTKTIDR
jgi:WD40 repeat protein